jgi:hypothetical protein
MVWRSIVAKLYYDISGYMIYWWADKIGPAPVYTWDYSASVFEVAPREYFHFREDSKLAGIMQQHILINAIWEAKTIRR